MLMLLVLMVLASQGLGVADDFCPAQSSFGTEFRLVVGCDLVQHLRHVVPGHGPWYPVLHGLSYLFPLRYYYLLYVHCALDGFSLTAAAPLVGALVVFALLPLLFVGRFRHIMERTAYVP